MFYILSQYRNENQNFNSNFVFQFITKNKMTLLVHQFDCNALKLDFVLKIIKED